MRVTNHLYTLIFFVFSTTAFSQVNNREEEWTPSSEDIPRYLEEANKQTPVQAVKQKPKQETGSYFESSKSNLTPAPAQQQESKTPAEAISRRSGVFWKFPDWNPPSFKLAIRPVGGQSFYKDPLSGDDIRITEVGLGMQVKNIPLIPGNPGFTISPAGTYAYGLYNQSGEGTDDYSRYWVGANAHLYFNSLRFKFGGYIGTWRQSSSNTTEFENNLHSYQAGVALRVNQRHYIAWDADYRRQFNLEFDLPSLTEIDQWLYWDASLKLLNMHLRIGPGIKSTRIFTPSGEELDKGNAFLIRANSSMQIWKLISASLGAIYVIDDNYSATVFANQPYRTPFQSRMGAFYDIALGEGTLDIHTRINLSNITPGVGLYLLYNHRIYDAFDSSERRHERGFSVGGGYSLPINIGN